jgi:hypothetical protein
MVNVGAVVPVNGIAGALDRWLGAINTSGVIVGVSALLLGTAIASENMIDAAITLEENDARPLRDGNFVMVNLSFFLVAAATIGTYCLD